MKRAFVLVVAAALASSSGCGKGKDRDDGTNPLVTSEELPALSIKDDTPDLLLTWIDEKGDMHVELKPGDVPAEGKSLVRVVVSDREDGTKGLFYVVDLTKKREDGTYPARTMTRRAWEAEVEKRRSAYLAKISPPKPTAPASGAQPEAPPSGKNEPQPPANASDVTVIIYGADWCKPCHEAENYLRSKGVRVVKKDIEESPAAATEMREKLEKSGQRGGSIPVLDVRGQIIVGWSPFVVERALKKAQSNTTAL